MGTEDDPLWTIVEHYLKGDADAIAMCRIINRVVNIWDDLIDIGQRPIAEINEAFIGLFCELPRNRFYQTFRTDLQPVIEASIWSWLAANEFETGTREDVARAHVLRFAGLDVFVMAARILGGYYWAAEAARELRHAIPNETLEQFRGELHGDEIPQA